MELTKKATILFSKRQWARLERLARSRKTSVGELVRTACERQYATVSDAERLRAAETLADLSLPVGTPSEMKRESVPRAEDLLP